MSKNQIDKPNNGTEGQEIQRLPMVPLRGMNVFPATVNTLDIGEYLGGAPISIQTAYGMEYLKNFLGADTVIVTSEIPQKTVLATPADNIVLYYSDPSNADFKELGLDYTTGNGPTNLIGIHKEGNYGRVMGETHALIGMKLWAEYLDGIANITIGSNSTGGNG